ncbi:ABC transporter substrate-binding protein [Breznakiella homolactica]|uniref:ABC transporter substrate-binding protein n=1 Tax=Breznakiella homolactica TaxID=2798577 RepID=A0A7T7XM46_9SPIR|nr:ABC transporter substrate-binding protein [Breznakiella homolactica]QQO08831.1 ABC transporter substrate-binding protein [Breznakiella homolactica]
MKRMVPVFLILGLAAMMFTSCSGSKDTPSASSGAGGAQYKDTLNVVIESEPSTLFPYDQNEFYTETIIKLIYDTLIYRTNDDKWEFTSEVAKSWEYIADNQVRFHLNDNIYFSNGEKMTAEDVKFSLETANTFTRVLFYKQLDKVEVVDDLTVDVYTFGPNPALFSNLAHPRSSLISKKYYEEVGKEGYARKPVGSGPYTLANWNTGIAIDVKARDNYWRGTPGTPNIHFSFVPEAASRSVEMETGAADIVTSPDYNDLDRMTGLGFEVVAKKSARIAGVFVNYGNVPDLKIRQALAYAIDYPAVVEAVYGNMATVADGIFPNTVPGYEKNWTISYNLEKAKQLVAESRTPRGLSLEVMSYDQTETSQLAEILQFYWKQIGIDVKISQNSFATVQKRQSAGDYQLYPMASQYGTLDPSRATYQFDGKIPTMLNLPPEINAEFKSYWDRGATEIDLTKRLAIYKEYQEKIVEQVVYIPIAHKMIAYITSKNVEGFYGAPGGITTLWQVKVKK